MLKLYIIGIFIFTHSVTVVSRNLIPEFQTKIIELINEIGAIKIIDQFSRHDRALITYIETVKGRKYCVKQFLGYRLQDQFCLISEILASMVAESADIPVNFVRIIPKNVQFPGKVFKERCATLHSFAQGTTLNQSHQYCTIDLRQKWKNCFSAEQQGITRSLIHDMSLHSELIDIVAFDTFVCNADRSKTNILYDNNTNSFCGVDLEMAWRRPYTQNLADIAYANIALMFKDEQNTLSKQEVNALKKYNSMLKKLVDNNTPEKLHVLFDQLVSQVSITSECIPYEKRHKFVFLLDKFVVRYKGKISQSYESSKKLIGLIDDLLDTRNGRKFLNK